LTFERFHYISPIKMPSSPAQLSLPVRQRSTWGGKRAGAGRKAKGKKGIPHRSRPVVSRYPMHLTWRMREHLWNLRSGRAFRIISAALEGLRDGQGMRVVHFSVQGNQLHLVVEAKDAETLYAGTRSLGIRLARGLNAMMGRAGSIFVDRYHARLLRTPTEVRNAIAYVLGNHRHHAARWAGRVPEADRFSSAAAFDGWKRAPRIGEGDPPPVSRPNTWLLRVGWRLRGLIDPAL
jgi:REP element-mobilizing transposase RayT